jgi:hypothetical protein
MEGAKTSNRKKKEAVIDGRFSFRYSGSKCLVYCQKMHHVPCYGCMDLSGHIYVDFASTDFYCISEDPDLLSVF